MLTRLEQKGDAQTPLDKLILRLSQQYPGDVGIFAPIILNYVVVRRAMQQLCRVDGMS